MVTSHLPPQRHPDGSRRWFVPAHSTYPQVTLTSDSRSTTHQRLESSECNHDRSMTVQPAQKRSNHTHRKMFITFFRASESLKFFFAFDSRCWANFGMHVVFSGGCLEYANKPGNHIKVIGKHFHAVFSKTMSRS